MSKRDREFIHTVQDYYVEHGRSHLPWRKTTNPYRILLSEVMLQQTQVERVIEKYKVFLKTFPSAKALADASLGEVLVVWQGLGYNRRAKLLHQCAKAVVEDRKNRWPKNYEELLALPGIGPYTAGAVMAFAYNQAVPIIETNIRTVYLHHWFQNQQDVSDKDILKLVAKHLIEVEPRAWYAALMDYGTYLKKTVGNQNHRAKTYQKQSRFAGSNRQARGAIIKALSTEPLTRIELEKTLPDINTDKIHQQLTALQEEGLIAKQGKYYQLP